MEYYHLMRRWIINFNHNFFKKKLITKNFKKNYELSYPIFPNAYFFIYCIGIGTALEDVPFFLFHIKGQKHKIPMFLETEVNLSKRFCFVFENQLIN